jgi:hypothetical protein
MTKQSTTQREQSMSTAFVAWRISGRYVDTVYDEISARRLIDRYIDDAGTHKKLEVFTAETHKPMFADGQGYVVPRDWTYREVQGWHASVLAAGLAPERLPAPSWPDAPAEPSAEKAFKANLLQWLSEEVDAYCDAWPQLPAIPVAQESRPDRLEDFAQFLAQVRLPQLFEKEQHVRMEFELTQRRIWGPWDEKS